MSFSVPPLQPEVLPQPNPYASRELEAQAAREQRKIQDLLASLGFALRSFNNLNQLLELVPFMACRVTDAHAGMIVLFKDNRLRMEHIYCPQYPTLQELQRAFVLLGDEPVPSDSTVLDTRLREFLNPNLSLFGTPILVKSTVRGYLWVLSQEEGYEWSESKQKLLRLVADQTAVAIQNEELHAQLRSQKNLVREIDIGSEIQERLLPKTCPAIPGLDVAARCENASKVGGDYYDFIPILHTERWGLVLGDVMGKGVPAGLLMMMTRGTLRSEVLREEPPDQILTHLNRVMYQDLENSNRFVTLFYAEYEPSSRRLSFCNAAHPRPLYWQARTGKFYPLEEAGTLIGLNPDTTYTQETMYLEEGDVLVCYTDGFPEAANYENKRYGEEHWSRDVEWAAAHHDTPEQILDYLFHKVHEFCGDTPTDDMTMMVLKAR
ncbi:PP2C family protein-serine/threonine phosphatase [Anthocerotibacter panamensis]|uniref:PP2C family protein-serine/threonine phosphatase n=1 Tax=Anthocerotibacter panamensis TaxID=2857077 RepID=UPI001C40557D|nr:GAF domain-containing SpoIIE family protein phosphatase [Anthocerotibacter panamensis]